MKPNRPFSIHTISARWRGLSPGARFFFEASYPQPGPAFRRYGVSQVDVLEDPSPAPFPSPEWRNETEPSFLIPYDFRALVGGCPPGALFLCLQIS